jgi:hypothetical protein
VFTLPCDDGNTVNGDGCSSACKVEKSYTCSGGSATTPSICTYTGKFVTITLTTITSSSVANQALFIFTMVPPLFNLEQKDLTSSVSLKSDAALSIACANYTAG